MPSKVDLAARRALEAAATTRQAEKKKKVSVAKVGQYELKRIRRGPSQLAARTPSTDSPTVVLEAIPLLEWNTAESSRPAAIGGSLPESARERIRPALLLGEVRRFKIMIL